MWADAIKGPIKLVKSIDKLHINRYTPPGVNVITRALESNQMVEDLIGKTTNLFWLLWYGLPWDPIFQILILARDNL